MSRLRSRDIPAHSGSSARSLLLPWALALARPIFARTTKARTVGTALPGAAPRRPSASARSRRPLPAGVGLGAPTIGADTSGLRRTQARATWAIGTPRASASCCTASMTGRRTVSRKLRRPCRCWSVGSVHRRAGEAGLARSGSRHEPTPRSPQIANSSRSSWRCSRLYWSCIDTKRVQPFSSAACWSFANCQAYMEERRGSGPCRP